MEHLSPLLSQHRSPTNCNSSKISRKSQKLFNLKMSAPLRSREQEEAAAVQTPERHKLEAQEENAAPQPKKEVELEKFPRPQRRKPRRFRTPRGNSDSDSDLPRVRSSDDDKVDWVRFNVGSSAGPSNQNMSSTVYRVERITRDKDDKMRPDTSEGDRRRDHSSFRDTYSRQPPPTLRAVDAARIDRSGVYEVSAAIFDRSTEHRVNTAIYDRSRAERCNTATYDPSAPTSSNREPRLFEQRERLLEERERGLSASIARLTPRDDYRYTVPASLSRRAGTYAVAAHTAGNSDAPSAAGESIAPFATGNSVAPSAAGNSGIPPIHCLCREKVCIKCRRTICADCPGLQRSNTL
jgi:hypothetical protein